MLLNFSRKTSKQIIVLSNAGLTNALFARKILLHPVAISQPKKTRCKLNQSAVSMNTKEIGSLHIFARFFVVVSTSLANHNSLISHLTVRLDLATSCAIVLSLSLTKGELQILRSLPYQSVRDKTAASVRSHTWGQV